MAFGAAAIVAVAANSVTVDGDGVETRPIETSTATPTSPSSPPATSPTVASAPATSPATTVVQTTMTDVTTTTTPPTAPPITTPPVSAEPLVVPPLVDVHDATGYMVVQLPDGWQVDGEPIELQGVHLHQVSAAADIERYLAGDLSVVGASVLDAPIGDLGQPADFAALFDPGPACRPSATETGVVTPLGDAIVLGYTACGEAGSTLVLVALDAAGLERSLFVGVQGGRSSLETTRELAFTIIGSYRVA